MASNCKNCRFFFRPDNGRVVRAGICRRLPPIQQPSMLGGHASYPTVCDDGWCGEHKPDDATELEASRIFAESSADLAGTRQRGRLSSYSSNGGFHVNHERWRLLGHIDNQSAALYYARDPAKAASCCTDRDMEPGPLVTLTRGVLLLRETRHPAHPELSPATVWALGEAAEAVIATMRKALR
jgi:hypothetical protein